MSNGLATKRVLGLTGRELPVKVKFNTFCQLCQYRLHQGDEALYLPGGKWEFYVHTDCALAKLTKMHNVEFRKNAKQRNKPKRTRKNTKKVFQGDGTMTCGFCWKAIAEAQTYVRAEKKLFHNEGRNSCWTRFRRVTNNTKQSIW